MYSGSAGGPTGCATGATCTCAAALRRGLRCWLRCWLRDDVGVSDDVGGHGLREDCRGRNDGAEHGGCLDTSPAAAPMHWMQTILLLREPFALLLREPIATT